ncbi:metallophosphoesterase [Virgibacillus sp. W0181]|uniref:metallophosphoesterase n=1 Tax=Virgibacillus sp. W0181 TaxID=3391581 RepID=UPI003F47B120
MSKIKKGFVVLIVALVCLFVFMFWDNERITVREQAIVLENLPDALDDYTILQVSDLHDKMFGKNQHRLANVINSLDFDAIVFTGDMVDDAEKLEEDVPFFILLDQLDHQDNRFFVLGNDDPPSYDVSPVLEKSFFIKELEKRGVQFVESVLTVEQGDARVHFANVELSLVKKKDYVSTINGVDYKDYMKTEAYKSHERKNWAKTAVFEQAGEKDVFIGLTHYPISDIRYDYIKNDSKTIWRDFDVILAGHYHGGQIRLPFLGAMFIPDPWYEPNSFFPPQDRVQGLWEVGETQQYVSAGLGTSEAIPFLKFRLFNPPEINILTLKRK